MTHFGLRHYALAVGLAVGLAAASPIEADAATATASIAVSAVVLNACAVVASPLAFGNYNPTSATATTGTTTIVVTCTTGVPFTVALNQGANGASVTTRQMKLGATANVLNYGLFQDSGHATNWGQTAGTDTQGTTATATPTTYTVYGQINAGQNVPSGTYNDTVQVTVNY